MADWCYAPGHGGGPARGAAVLGIHSGRGGCRPPLGVCPRPRGAVEIGGRGALLVLATLACTLAGAWWVCEAVGTGLPRGAWRRLLGEDARRHWILDLVLGIAVAVALCGLLACQVARCNKILVALIARLDRNSLGADVVIGNLRLSLGLCHFLRTLQFGLTVTAQDVTIKNPHPFTSDYFIHADSLAINIPYWPILRSCGSVMNVDYVELSDVHVNIEYSGNWRSCGALFTNTSNLEVIQDFIDQKLPSSDVEHLFAEGRDMGELGRIMKTTLSLAVGFVAAIALMVVFGANLSADLWAAASNPVFRGIVVLMAGGLFAFVLCGTVLMLVMAPPLVGLYLKRETLECVVKEVSIFDMKARIHGGVSEKLADKTYEDFPNQVGRRILDDLFFLIIASVIKMAFAFVDERVAQDRY